MVTYDMMFYPGWEKALAEEEKEREMEKALERFDSIPDTEKVEVSKWAVDQLMEYAGVSGGWERLEFLQSIGALEDE